MSTSPEVNQDALEVTRSPEELEIITPPSLPEIAPEDANFPTLKTAVLDIIGVYVDIREEHKPALLTFTKKKLEEIAEKEDLPLDTGPVADTWQSIRRDSKVKKQDLLKQKDNTPNKILGKVAAVLVQELVTIIQNEQSPPAAKPVAEVALSPEPALADPKTTKSLEADKQKEYEEQREYFARKQPQAEKPPAQPKKQPRKKTVEQKPEPQLANIQAPLPPRPVTLELLDKVEFPASLGALRATTRLPIELAKVFAVHIGIQENPGFDTENAKAKGLINLVRERAIEPAEDVANKRKELGRDPLLTPVDRLIIEKLLPRAVHYGDTPMSYETLLTALKEKKYLELEGVTPDNLRQTIQAIFEVKIPRLLGLKAK